MIELDQTIETLVSLEFDNERKIIKKLQPIFFHSSESHYIHLFASQGKFMHNS